MSVGGVDGEALPVKKIRYSLTLDNGSAAPAAPPPPPAAPGSSSDEAASGERTGTTSPVLSLPTLKTPGLHEAGPA